MERRALTPVSMSMLQIQAAPGGRHGGCAKGAASAALAAILVLTVACTSAPRKSPAQERADAATTERIYAALEANPIYYFRDVEVNVDDGVALLSGYVWTTDALYHAQEITRGIPGVTRVRSAMELERQGNRGGGDTAGN